MSFHINPETGEPKRCVARPGNCRYGEDANHYDDKNSARQAYEKSQSINSALEGSKLIVEIPKHPEATFEEVSNFRNDAIKNNDVTGEILATYSMMARSVIKDYPDAATVSLLATEYGVDIAEVYDSYGSKLGYYDVYDGGLNTKISESDPSNLITQFVDQAGYRGDDHREAWGGAYDEAQKTFRDKSDRGWKSRLDSPYLDLATAADWGPKALDTPEKAFKEVRDFRESAMKSGNVKDEIVATYSMMARSVIKEHPSAATVEVLTNNDGDRYYMRVYDANGSEIHQQQIWNEPHPNDAEDTPARLLSNLYGDGNGYRGDDFYEELGDSMSQADDMFRDKERKEWHKTLQHERWDLTAAAAWKPKTS